eukprot:TRINITY_DN20451_c0_g1_i1.p1 TRINITY_DN20451_c0_g1~~TRINITY_DN20451_c0_g1_i1.p1  ORF type:complete len:120 (+),score=26.10 TRINITY_DN20451_c0_g1_i1:40-360(+)
MRLTRAAPLVQSRWMGAAPAALGRAQIAERVLGVVKEFRNLKPEKKAVVSETSHFVNDLGLDSLDGVEVVLALEDEFTIVIPDEAADKIRSCKDAIDYIAKVPEAK